MDALHDERPQHLSVFTCKGEGQAAQGCDLFAHLDGVNFRIVTDNFEVVGIQPADHFFPGIVLMVYVPDRLSENGTPKLGGIGQFFRVILKTCLPR